MPLLHVSRMLTLLQLLQWPLHTHSTITLLPALECLLRNLLSPQPLPLPQILTAELLLVATLARGTS